MSYPGSFPGDPAEQQPGLQPYPGPGAREYPTVGGGMPPPRPYLGPPAGYAPPSPGYSPAGPPPPGYFPPPPPYQPYDAAYPPYPPQYPPQHPSPYGPQQAAPFGPQAPANGLAIGSLVSSLVALPGYFICFGFIGSILGIVLGIAALNQIGKSGQKGREMAIAGILLGALGLLVMGAFSLLVASPSLWY